MWGLEEFRMRDVRVECLILSHGDPLKGHGPVSTVASTECPKPRLGTCPGGRRGLGRDLPAGRNGRYDTTMRRAEVIALVSARRDEIVQRFGVRSLSLFGSVARDEARPDSDVDVLVEFEGPTTFDSHMGLLIFLEDLLGRRVDVLTAKGIKSRLRPLIDQDLVRVA